MFLTLSALYNSWGLPLAILLSVPLAVLGALLFVGAAYLVSPEFINNIYMQISLVMLIGLRPRMPFWSWNMPISSSSRRTWT